MNKCVFFDRDGTINVDYGYVYKTEDFVFRKNFIEALRILKAEKYLVIVITNQSGIAKGFYNENDVIKLHHYINHALKRKGVFIDDFYYCPHSIDGVVKKYKKECSCRKPNIGLIMKAQKDYNIDLSNSFMIGDKISDMQTAHNANLKKSFMISENNLLWIVSQILSMDK